MWHRPCFRNHQSEVRLYCIAHAVDFDQALRATTQERQLLQM